MRQKVVEIEVKEGSEGQNTQNFLPYGTGYYKKCDGSHWRKDLKTKSELHFKTHILTVFHTEWIVRGWQWKEEDHLEWQSQ